MGTSSKTKGQKCDWDKMGLQKQANEDGQITINKARLVCKLFSS
jgi:hypothetical protein